MKKKSLLKWQAVSFISRGVAMIFGIIQSSVIVRILTVSEYGLVNIVVSIGSAFGIYQHLGLASGSTREISSADDKDEIFKIFVTSAAIRYFVTIPLAIIMFLLSKSIAISQYGSPEIVTPIRIFSFILLIQGMQSILNAVISGMRRFKALFIYQMIIAAVSLFIYIPLIYFYKVDGYFYALALFNLVGSLSLAVLAFKPLKGHFKMPTKQDFGRLLKEILSISLGIYVIKIIYTYWQRSGPLLLGTMISAEQVGIFSFALLYGGKLMTVSDSVTDVNLPVLSRQFKDNIDEFKNLFLSNFDKIFGFIVFSALSAIFWAREIMYLFVGSQKYDDAYPFILPLVIAFVFYSVINIIKSSILIPAKLVKEMIIGFVIMLGGTISFYFAGVGYLGPLFAMSYGMVFGSFIGLISMLIFSKIKLDFLFLNLKHLTILIIGLLFSILGVVMDFSRFSPYKFGVYFMAALAYLLVIMQLRVITTENLKIIGNSIKRRVKK